MVPGLKTNRKNENTCSGIMDGYFSRHIFDYFFCDRANIV